MVDTSTDLGIGSALRAARVASDRSREDVARRLQMRTSQLGALEDEEFAVFGGDAYARAFIRSVAREVGLDPEPLVAAFRAHVEDAALDTGSLTARPVTTSSSRPGAPAWVGWVAGLALLLAAGWVLVGFVGSRAPAPAQVAVASPPPAPAEPTAPDQQGRGAGRDAAEEPTPVRDGVDVVLVFEERAWVRVSSDGTVVQEGEQPAGSVAEYRGEDEVLARIGNAGGVRARLNGEGVGRLGDSGSVVDVRFTRDGVEQP